MKFKRQTWTFRLGFNDMILLDVILALPLLQAEGGALISRMLNGFSTSIRNETIASLVLVKV